MATKTSAFPVVLFHSSACRCPGAPNPSPSEFIARFHRSGSALHRGRHRRPTTARKFIGEPETPNFEVRRTPIGIVRGIPVEVWASGSWPIRTAASPEKRLPFAAIRDVDASPPWGRPDQRSADSSGRRRTARYYGEPRPPRLRPDTRCDYIRNRSTGNTRIRWPGDMERSWPAATTYRTATARPTRSRSLRRGSRPLTALRIVLRRKSPDFLKPKSCGRSLSRRDDANAAELRRMSTGSPAASPTNRAWPCCATSSSCLHHRRVRIRGAQYYLHTAVKSLVALRRVDPPTPWGHGPEHESLADEVIDQLEAAAIVTGDEARSSVARSPGRSCEGELVSRPRDPRRPHHRRALEA